MRDAWNEWARLGGLGRRLLERHWRQLLQWRERFRPSEAAFHLVLAALVGILAGLANLVFYAAIESLKLVAPHHPNDLVEVAEMFSPWTRFATPVLGALAAGLVLHWGPRLLGHGGSANILEVVVAGDGRLPWQPAAVNAISSLLSIGTGASIGREGSITQLGAMLGSQMGQWARWPPYRLRLLVACGAAAGMAAAYNAPVAGAVFAAQIVLGNFAMNLFAPLLCASVVAAVVSRSFFGIEPWYHVPVLEFTRLAQLPWFLALGALCGALGAGFLKAMGRSQAFFQGLGVPIYVRLTLAGLAVGGLAVYYPEVWGNGYSVASRILEDRYTLGFLAGLLVAKFAATVTAVGAGTVGGVFTPTMFLGAALGSLLGHGLEALGWTQLPSAAFALVGMASVVAATTQSPLLALILVFEISLNYSLMPPLMLACAVATLLGRRLHPDSVYTAPLRARGIPTVEETERLGAAIEHTVGDLMQKPIPPLRETAPFRQIADRFLASPNNFLPVVDAAGRLLGVVALQDLKAYLNTNEELQGVIAFDLMRPPPPCLTPGERLQDALPKLLASELRNIPVVGDLQERRLVGSVSRATALALLSEAIAASSHDKG